MPPQHWKSVGGVADRISTAALRSRGARRDVLTQVRAQPDSQKPVGPSAKRVGASEAQSLVAERSGKPAVRQTAPHEWRLSGKGRTLSNLHMLNQFQPVHDQRPGTERALNL
jgi:hypothetical protein